MRHLWTKLTGIAALLFFLSSQALAAVAEDEAIVIVADSRRFTGWKAWWTNLYNESHLYFAVLTIIIVPVIGAILGAVTGALMARIGINLRSRDLAEH